MEIDTSARVSMVVLAVELLFDGFVSALELVAVAVLLMTEKIGISGSGCTV